MMRGTSLGEYSSGDDSSDIRTVRTNTTNVFSQASTYYTNPTLAPPPSHHRMITTRNSNDDNDDDDEDQTTLTDDISTLDYTSPTSIMTNYESYSKFGAAPIYQNVVVPTTTAQQRRALQQQQLTNGSKGDVPVFSLNTIAEETMNASTKSPNKVYHPPSYYKNQRRTTTTATTTTTSGTASNITTVPCNTTTTPATRTSSSNTSNNHNNMNHAATKTTNSYDDGSTVTDHLTTTGSSAASRTTHSSGSTGTSNGNNRQKHSEHRTTVSSSSPSSPPPPATTSTAFSIFKRMTTGNSPLRNRSPSPSPVPTISSSPTHPKESNVVPTSSTMSAGSSSSSSSSCSTSGNGQTTTGTSNNTQPPPPPTRSLRNYMHTLAYKSRRTNSPNTVSSGRVTPPPSSAASKKSESHNSPISPTSSVHSATSHTKHNVTSSPPPAAATAAAQELVATPIKSNFSSHSSNNSNHLIPKTELPFVDGTAGEYRDRKSLEDHDNVAVPNIATCPTTTSTITTTGSSSTCDTKSSDTPYCNPILKSVSSKLFVPLEEEDLRTNSNLDDTVPKARLNLDMIDQLEAASSSNGGGNDVTHLHSSDVVPKESFRLWTDEDSAFGTSWYSFSTSPFGGDHDDTIDMSMESHRSATGGGDGVVAVAAAAVVTAPNVPTIEYPRSNVPSEPSVPTTKPMIVPSVTSIPPSVMPPSGKLSLSLLQLKHLHRTSSMGSTDDDEDTTHRYPSMVSSEFEDEGGASTLSGTINYPNDDCTTLGGGPSFDFSVSACMDDESLTNNKEKVATTKAVLPSRTNPIVYSNVGQALSHRDVIPTQSMSIAPSQNKNNNHIPKAGSRFVPPGALERPLRRRSSSTGKRSLSTPPQSPLEVIDEHTSHDHKLSHLQESASEPSSTGGHTSSDTMVVVSLAEASNSSSKKQPNSPGRHPTDGHKEETVRVVRRLDSIQIGIILLISVALAAIICATFCVVGSCHVGKNKDTDEKRVLAVVPIISQKSLASSPTNYLRSPKRTEIVPMTVLPP